jgi:hypothetical protein
MAKRRCRQMTLKLCPFCGGRADSRAEICCDRCCLGHKDCGPQYFDAKGHHIPWEPTDE